MPMSIFSMLYYPIYYLTMKLFYVLFYFCFEIPFLMIKSLFLDFSFLELFEKLNNDSY